MGFDTITGATGHLGNVLARELRAQGRAVRAVAASGDDVSPLHGLGVELVTADVRDPAALQRAFAGSERVFHLAGLVSITTGQESLLQAVNVQGTRNVVEACRAVGVRRLVYTSSVHALTEPAQGVLDETAGFDPARASGAYGKSKAAASLEVQGAARAGALDAVLVLPTGVVGPFDFRLSEVGELLLGLEAGRVPFLVAGAHDFVDVRDVAAGTIAAAERGRTGEAYLLAGERVEVVRLAATVARLSGARVPPLLPLGLARVVAGFAPVFERVTGRRALLTPYALHALRAPFTVSHEKASRDLGFSPRPIATSVADALEWHHAGRARRRVAPGRVSAFSS
ncbi:MAG: NAD-dependent epimerase/dehydratase family protein [Myxococcaceae bacterium]|nr:NAD-dependent epimerase/dehydratase family protein [Myxococcaceae bacterium]